jgi:hypothetical protein
MAHVVSNPEAVRKGLSAKVWLVAVQWMSFSDQSMTWCSKDMLPV